MTSTTRPASVRRTRLGTRLGTRLAAGALALVATSVLAGCGDGVSPGVAATVGDESISVTQVDDLATVICATQGGAGGGSPTAGIRTLALNVLLGIEIGEGVGDPEAVDREVVAQSVSSAAQARAAVPEDLRPLFDQVVEDSTRAQVALDTAARESLQAQGQDATDQNAVDQESARLQLEYLESQDVEVAPRFGTLQEGQLVAGDGSLSVAVSENATAVQPSGTDDPMAAGADVPASQRCS